MLLLLLVVVVAVVLAVFSLVVVLAVLEENIYFDCAYISTTPLTSCIECSSMAQEIVVQFQDESYQRLKKLYLMPPCLTLSIIRYGSMVKWNNPGKGVASSPTSLSNSYWKGSFGHQLYILQGSKKRLKEKYKSMLGVDCQWNAKRKSRKAQVTQS